MGHLHLYLFGDVFIVATTPTNALDHLYDHCDDPRAEDLTVDLVSQLVDESGLDRADHYAILRRLPSDEIANIRIDVARLPPSFDLTLPEGFTPEWVDVAATAAAWASVLPHGSVIDLSP